MNGKIKTVYIITIAAIVAFLLLQAHWLYSTFNVSVNAYEAETFTNIKSVIAQYDSLRYKAYNKINADSYVLNSFLITHSQDAVTGKSADAKMLTYSYDIRTLMNVSHDAKITDKMRADAYAKGLELVDNGDTTHLSTIHAIVHSYPAHEMLQQALVDARLDIDVPFCAAHLDSMLSAHGYDAQTKLVAEPDSMRWYPQLVRHTSALHPRMTVIYPYNTLNKRVAVVSCSIPLSDVMRRMMLTFVVIIVVSALLVSCLVMQIRTIAQQIKVDELRTHFVHTMIHELKRPITTLKMCVSGLENEKMCVDRSTRAALLADSRSSLNDLSSYFSKLRDLSFSAVEQIPLSLSSFALRDAVAEVFAKIAIPTDKSVQLQDISADDITMVADRVHVVSILSNLAENAMKYAGNNITVTVDCVMLSEHELQITVADNGKGLSESDLTRVFDRFYRAKDAQHSNMPGLGLGLAYVKLLVEAHGGSVTAKSDLEKGTKFIVKFPQP
jgi:two-component system phosphate regulon sensor histidine kinase PhoR